jgi:hypothetical protein
MEPFEATFFESRRRAGRLVDPVEPKDIPEVLVFIIGRRVDLFDPVL